MSSAHFFKVFDKAWKKVTSNPQIAVSGFRKCGLMPFNPNAITYDRLIEKTDSVSSSSASNELSTFERVGITRAFQEFESSISDEWRTLFTNR